MLKYLSIRNYTLIETLDIPFENGFSVITGETGAGKSILLGAIGLLLGQRADSKLVRSGAPKCIIEAQFDLTSYGLEPFFEKNDLEFDGCECIIRREIAASGKSRAFINDTPAQLSQLKELGESLLDIHSQHKNLLLNKENFQLDILDILAHNSQTCQAYSEAYKQYREIQKSLRQAEEDARRDKEEEDYLTYQYQQLKEAELQPDEQTSLEEEAELLAHTEEIKQALFEAQSLLNSDENGLLSSLRSATHILQGIQQVYPQCNDMQQRMESCYIELKDIAAELENSGEQIEFNPRRMDEVNDRLNILYTLQKKHNVSSVEALIEIRDNIEQKINRIENSEEYIQTLRNELEKKEKELHQKAEELTAQRRNSSQEVEQQVSKLLMTLGMPNVRFKVELIPSKTFTPRGMDQVCFLFNANRGGALQDLTQIASGGEIARVMLSLKALIAGAVKLPTIIFDEIDTGVSGHIAEKMAYIMQEMGRNNRQVISITHLPQIAAKGKHHYKVYKEEDGQLTTSHIVQLNEEERVEEIANMLSGSTRTEAAINNAKELLKDDTRKE